MAYCNVDIEFSLYLQGLKYVTTACSYMCAGEGVTAQTFEELEPDDINELKSNLTLEGRKKLLGKK